MVSVSWGLEWVGGWGGGGHHQHQPHPAAALGCDGDGLQGGSHSRLILGIAGQGFRVQRLRSCCDLVSFLPGVSFFTHPDITALVDQA